MLSPQYMRLLPLNIILYMAVSLTGVILVHVALDNISKFLKEGLMKDRFNFENESFEQCEELIETPANATPRTPDAPELTLAP